MMIDKNKNGVTAQTDLQSCSLPHLKIVDADNNSCGQFIDDSDLSTVGFVQLKRLSDFQGQFFFSLSLSGILLLRLAIFFSGSAQLSSENEMSHMTSYTEGALENY